MNNRGDGPRYGDDMSEPRYGGCDCIHPLPRTSGTTLPHHITMYSTCVYDAGIAAIACVKVAYRLKWSKDLHLVWDALFLGGPRKTQDDS